MDIVFKCPKCEQQLEVDSSAIGSEIQCPACNNLITIPEPDPDAAPPAPVEMPPEAPAAIPTPSFNPISSSAAAKEEKHFSVPSHEGPAEVLIKKANKPLEVAAVESDRKLRVKTIRHSDCIEVGRDRFDEMVTDFLQKVGEKHIVALHPVSFTVLNPTTQKLMDDYGLLIVFHG